MISIERETFHNLIQEFKHYVKDDSVFDIGKSLKHSYKSEFKKLYTVDVNPDLKPDIVMDAERDEIRCDHFLCNGVTEQCNDPFMLARNLFRNQTEKGYGLWGIILTGYPLYDTDYVRFTENGARKLLKQWKTIREHLVYRDKTPSYYYAIVRKP